MGCGDECPWVPARQRTDWALPEPRDLTEPEYERLLDDVEARVIALVESLLRERRPTP
jgi:hypothetical protein